MYGVHSLNVTHLADRYLCGGEALKSLRKVSRMRLVLDAECITTDDIEAKSLNNLIRKYQKVKEYFDKVPSGKLLLDDLTVAHKLLDLESPKYGVFRKCQSWIGKNKNKPAYVTPNVESMYKMLILWLNKVNESQQTIESALYAYSNLLLIHPFLDGNGRVARGFLNAQLQKLTPEIPSISLFRLGKNTPLYVESIQSMEWEHQSKTSLPEYWCDALSWCNELDEKITVKWRETANKVYSKFMLQPLDDVDKSVIIYVLETPAFDPINLQIKLNIPQQKLANSIKKLCRLGIINAGVHKEATTKKFFYSNVIFESLNEIEDFLYEK